MQTAELNIFISQVEKIIYEMRSSGGRILLLLQFCSVSFGSCFVLFFFLGGMFANLFTGYKPD